MAESQALLIEYSYVESVKLLETDLRCIQDPEPNKRQVALVTLCDKVRFSFQKRFENSFFCECLPHLLRFERACPLKDVRDTISSLLAELESSGLAPPLRPPIPCLLDTGTEFDFLFADEHPSSSFLTDLFIYTGRVSHLDMFLSIIPNYAEKFIILRDFLMNAEGPLPRDYRQYIAIMAASRYDCEYLVNLHSFMFLEARGDPAWLEDLSKAPPKLQKLAKLNAVLAHQPWLMSDELIAELLDESPVWRPPELIQAVMILTFFHMSCGLVEGFHISSELDLFAQPRSDGVPPPAPPVREHSGVISATDQESLREEEEETIKLHALLGKGEANIKIVSDSENEQTDDPFFSVGDVSMKYHLVTESLETCKEVRIKCMTGLAASPATPEPLNSSSAVANAIAKFRGDNDMAHVDIDTRAKRLKHNEFSWEVQGKPLVGRFYLGFADVLDEEYKTLKSLTDGKLNDRTIDTGPFRTAIARFASGIYGIQDDMYDYHKVNVYLSAPMKTHLKLLVTDPKRIQHFPLNLNFYEKVHLSALALLAKRRACLTWALRSIHSATR